MLYFSVLQWSLTLKDVILFERKKWFAVHKICENSNFVMRVCHMNGEFHHFCHCSILFACCSLDSAESLLSELVHNFVVTAQEVLFATNVGNRTVRDKCACQQAPNFFNFVMFGLNGCFPVLLVRLWKNGYHTIIISC